MRLTIKGRIAVTVNSEEDLTTQEIIAAHQLATGNFEALFVSQDDEGERQGAPVVEDTRSISEPNYKERVYVEVLCPFCGFAGKGTTLWGNSFSKCPTCSEKLYNKYATGKKGERDSRGCHYKAEEAMIFKQEKEAYENMFSGGEAE